MKQVKPKKCRNCGKLFTPHYNPLQYLCEINCALEYNRKKKVEEKVQVFKKNLEDRGHFMKILQATFNTFIRLRDKGKPCICCDKPLGEKYHAGHFFSTGAFPGLRIDEDNCHGQREDCNLHKHGNAVEYAINLPKRIGHERYQALLDRRATVLKLTVPEIQEKIALYRAKIKELKQSAG